MSRRAQRRKALYAPEREELLRKAHALWSATCTTMHHLQTPSADYHAASDLAAALCSFASDLSGGAVDFARMASTRGGGDDRTWLEGGSEMNEAIDEALAICGGDPRATIRSLLVLTEFLEAEAEAEGKA
ncbi:hypothetical protein Sa4125_38980 [Aureimonas sp. SA4125]|nr:hypothetical protein Sa4125_38980 [Aureimonas sp. SA4125]